MFSLVELDLSTWPLVALDWLSIANDRTDGLLDVILAIGVVVPVVLAVWAYLTSSSGSEVES